MLSQIFLVVLGCRYGPDMLFEQSQLEGRQLELRVAVPYGPVGIPDLERPNELLKVFIVTEKIVTIPVNNRMKCWEGIFLEFLKLPL